MLQVTKPESWKDLNLNLVVSSGSSAPLKISINISVQAMRHNGTPAANIHTAVTEETLHPGKGGGSPFEDLKLPGARSEGWFHASPSVSCRPVHLDPGPFLPLQQTHVGR